MFTKTQSRSLALAAIAVAVGLGSHQALATSQTGTAKAAIVAAIGLTENTNMNFGYVIPGAGTGTLVLPASASPTPVATGVTYLNGAASGAWTVTGTSGQPMVVTLDSSDTLTGPGPAMTINAFTTDAPATFTSGSVGFHVGATLNVGTAASQTAGNYSGTYTVTVNY